jgi:hypothetical protein
MHQQTTRASQMQQENEKLNGNNYPSIQFQQPMMRATSYDDANPKVGRNSNKLLSDVFLKQALPFRLLETPIG